MLYSEAFASVVRKYLNIELSKDWIGRLYGIINPTIDITGHFDVSNMIIEIDGDNTNNNQQISNWVYKQLNMMSSLFHLDNLYNNISMDLKHVGPVNGDNYLIVFDITARREMAIAFRKWFIHTLVYIVIALIILLAI